MKLLKKSKSTEPQSVSKRRGRPRKQRRKLSETVTDESKRISLIGRFVSKEFSNSVSRIGKVVHYKIGFYTVEYEEGICEHLVSGDIRKILMDDCDLDDDLIRRKNELDEALLRKRKIVDESDKKSSELNVEEEEKNSSELNVEKDEEMRDLTDADLISDVETAVESWPQLELPPELMLPHSSGTIGVPDSCVHNLFSVYSFLRSFSARLFVSPFTLDEFVGALNCGVPNTLIDAVHNALMRALRRHLEKISSEDSKIASRCSTEGSKIASRCLR
jgi:hypothetical protein